MNTKQILINKIITDVMGLDDTGQEKEIGIILNKLEKLQNIEEGEMEQAEKEDALESEKPEKEITEEEFMDALS